MRIASIALTLLVIAPVRAQEELRWRLHAGDLFYVESKQHATGRSLAAGVATKLGQDNTAVLQVAVREARPGGGAVLEATYTAVRDRQTGYGDAPWATWLEGAPLRVTLDSELRATAVAGIDSAVRRRAAGQPESVLAVAQAYLEDDLKVLLEDLIGIVPGRVVRQGEKWERETGPSRPSGRMVLKRTLTAEGEEQTGGRRVRRIGLRGTVSVRPLAPGAISTGGDDVEVAEYDLRGRARFDAAAGRLVDAEHRVVSHMVWRAAFPGHPVVREETLELSASLRVLDRDPLAP